MNLIVPERHLLVPSRQLILPPRLAVARRRFGPPRRPSVMQQLLLAMGGGAVAPLTLDTFSDSGGLTGSPLEWSHTCNGGNRALIVGISAAYDSGAGAPGFAVTYNGVGMTSIGSVNVAQGNGSPWTQLFKLSNPASGANTVSVSWTGTVSVGEAGGISFTGAHQTTASLTGTAATGSDWGASPVDPSVSVTSANGEIVVDCLLGDPVNSTVTAGAGQTIRCGGNGVASLLVMSTEAAGGSPITMSYDQVPNANWLMIGVSVKPP